MPSVRYSTDEILEAVQKHGNQSAAADALGMKLNTLSKRLERHKAKDPFPIIPGKSILYDAKTGEEKLIWATGKGMGAPSLEEVATTIRDAFDDYTPPKTLPTAPQCEKDLATVYPLADLHVGLLSWKDETGTSWDTAIARKVIGEAMERLVGGSPASQQAVVLGLGDLLHADNFDNQTAKSKNSLDVDGRYPKILQVAAQLLLDVINLALEKHKNVLVRVLPGNHDEHSAHAITLALALHYKGHKRVTVDSSASRYWFWRWGQVMVGATHGDQAKMKDLPLIMATEKPDDWAAAKWRHIYTGHIHTQTSIEQRSVTVESFNTPVAADAWHAGMGYRANRSLQSITHHKERGEIMRQKVNL